MTSVTLSGVGLHSGTHARVTLTRTAGPICFIQNGRHYLRSELLAVRTDFGVTVADRGRTLSIDLVEHLFAALAAHNAQHGLQIAVEGCELPLLGGGAAEWFDALERLGMSRESPALRVTRPARFDLDSSSYEFTPNTRQRVEVVADFGAVLGTQRARFSGEVAQFREEIAPARTFGFSRDAAFLRERGRARHVDPDSVLVFEDDGTLALPGAPARPCELAAHKLLDLVGDSWLYGGLPEGIVQAVRPGHTKNHAAFERALEMGVLVRV